ncbi:hypothetical protein [Colwellia psychrerythraea]|uniref:Uncharacterized protein n=1 Tax=Colwellia psychrerythraea TaxID=28229 RepID=A0A099KV77_COLPS|nr:hypothetical protein [Colwellia psychrerythraea]KGJ93767.1 hypothetical protein GAB14E_2322 [Colwellia psychrerythraea]
MIKILVQNNTLSKRRFILYQTNSTDANINSYVWDSRTLDNGGSWMLEFPLSFSVAGRIQESGNANYTETSEAAAQEGEQWQLIRNTPQEPLTIVQKDNKPIGNEVEITYVSGAGKVNALLLKSSKAVVGKYLNLHSLVGFKLNNSFFIAISEDMKRGDVIVINELMAKHEVDTTNNKWVDRYEVTATENTTTSEITIVSQEKIIQPLIV